MQVNMVEQNRYMQRIGMLSIQELRKHTQLSLFSGHVSAHLPHNHSRLNRLWRDMGQHGMVKCSRPPKLKGLPIFPHPLSVLPQRNGGPTHQVHGPSSSFL